MQAQKRSRAELEGELASAKDEKHRAQKRARIFKEQLATLDLEESMARAIMVSWNALATEGSKSKQAWKKVTSRSELELNKDDGCIAEDGCFYSNYSRSDGAEELYKLRILKWNPGVRPSYKDCLYVCDHCYNERSDLLQELRECEWVMIDPQDYEPERVAAMQEYMKQEDEDNNSE
jgi:hypothetical protein